MDHVTYDELVELYGRELAFEYLLVLERSTLIQDTFVHLDGETRLERVFSAMNENSLGT